MSSLDAKWLVTWRWSARNCSPAVAVSVRCGGHAGRCRLSGGTTPRIAIEVEVLGLSAQEVKLAVAAPERFAARVSYRLVRGEGT